MRRVRPRALILGLGRFGGGRAAAQFLARRGFELRIADSAPVSSLRESYDALQAMDTAIDWRLGEPQDPSLLDGVDLAVVNPAIKPNHPLLERGAGVTWSQEPNLFLEAYPGRVVFVTGTNGKSTTATLLAACLERAGVDTLLGGNIGRSLLDAEGQWHANQVAVLEISSAQLSRIDPTVHRVFGTIATRITRDHVDWHGSVDAYRRAKARAFTAATEFIVHARDDETAENAPTTATKRVRYTTATPLEGEVGIQADWLVSCLEDPGRVMHPHAARLVGGFHVENFGAAYAASNLLGVGRHSAGVTMCDVEPLPHRLQLVAERHGRRIYGNAVSTEVQSTVSALRSVSGRIHWVGGGKSKDGDHAGVAEAIAPLVASAHVFGAAAPHLAPALASRVPTTQHDDLAAALDMAWTLARRGEAIVFSPAFASFDQYPNFTARAAAFDAWVERFLARPAGDAHGFDPLVHNQPTS